MAKERLEGLKRQSKSKRRKNNSKRKGILDVFSSTRSLRGDLNGAAKREPWDISRINKPWEIDDDTRRNLPYLARIKRDEQESPSAKFLRLTKLTLPNRATSVSLLEQVNGNEVKDAASITLETKQKYFGPTAKQECYAIFRKLAAQKYIVDGPLRAFVPPRLDALDTPTSEKSSPTRQSLPSLQGSPKTTFVTALNNATDVGSLAEVSTTSTTCSMAETGVMTMSASVPTLPTLPTLPKFETGSPTTQNSSRFGVFSNQFTARHKFTSLCLDQDLPPCIRLIIRNYFSPEINVSHMSIGDNLAIVFAQCLQELPMVTGLNIRNNGLKDAGLQAIVDVAVAKNDLYHLDLSENKVDGDASTSLAAYIGSTGCALQSLKLCNADVDDNELVPFAKALEKNRSLRTLDLGKNLIGSSENLNVVMPTIVTGGEALAEMLAINNTLTSLDLSWNFLRLGGAIEIGKAIANNTGLREINLAYNAFGNGGAQAIGESLLSNSTLEKIDLSNNNIPSQGALALASGLKANDKVVHMNLDGNPLGQAGGRSLLHAVAQLTDRRVQISLENCNFDCGQADDFDPSETTGSYDLNMSIPYERAIALELLRIANTKQGCKFLSITHVSTGETSKTRKTYRFELRETDKTDERRRLLRSAGILVDVEMDEEKLKRMQCDKSSLTRLFHELDEDDSGFIDQAELTKGMRTLGISFRDEDVPRYIAQYDVDGSGKMELEEFVECMASLRFGDSHVMRQVMDLDTNSPLTIPTEGQLMIDFVDLHVSADHDAAHSKEGVDRLLQNLTHSKNKAQMLQMAKKGMVFKESEAQMLLENAMDGVHPVQAVQLLLPNLVDYQHAFRFIRNNLNDPQRLRLQYAMGTSLLPILSISTGHYKLDLSCELDRFTLKKLVEISNRTSFLRKKDGLKDTSQHCNFHGFRNELLNNKPIVLEPNFVDTIPKFGTLEFDYVQIQRMKAHPSPISMKRLQQIMEVCLLPQMTPSMRDGDLELGRDVDGWTRQALTRSLDSRGAGIKPGTPSSKPGTPSSSFNNKRTGDPTPAPVSGTGTKRQSTPSNPHEFLVPKFDTPAIFALVDEMYSVKDFIQYGEGLNESVEVKPTAKKARATAETIQKDLEEEEEENDGDEEDQWRHGLTWSFNEEEEDEQEEQAEDEEEEEDDFDLKVDGDGENDGKPSTNPTDDGHDVQAAADAATARKEFCNARRLLMNLQWCLATHWITSYQAIRLLHSWPLAFAKSRIELVCLLFDRICDLHQFSGILSILSDLEVAQCYYRLGWLNIWSPLMPDNYYELNMTRYEEREVARMLVRLAVDEPGENWKGETFGWGRHEGIPGWELNMSWLKDGGFPDKGFLALEYYSGADQGCGPVWPSRKELAMGTLAGVPREIEQYAMFVDSLSLMTAQKKSRGGTGTGGGAKAMTPTTTRGSISTPNASTTGQRASSTVGTGSTTSMTTSGPRTSASNATRRKSKASVSE